MQHCNPWFYHPKPLKNHNNSWALVLIIFFLIVEHFLFKSTNYKSWSLGWTSWKKGHHHSPLGTLYHSKTYTYWKAKTSKYTNSQKFLNGKIFNVFKEFSSAHQACIYLIKNTAKAVTLWNILTIKNNSFLFEYILKCNLFLWSKLNFQHHYSSLQWHMILQKSL